MVGCVQVVTISLVVKFEQWPVADDPLTACPRNKYLEGTTCAIIITMNGKEKVIPYIAAVAAHSGFITFQIKVHLKTKHVVIIGQGTKLEC